MNESLLPIGALWRNEDNSKKVYLTIQIKQDIKAGSKLVAFQNKKKLNDNSEKDRVLPNYYIYPSREMQERGSLEKEINIDEINASL